jgi:hypothetical protein
VTLAVAERASVCLPIEEGGYIGAFVYCWSEKKQLLKEHQLDLLEQ